MGDGFRRKRLLVLAALGGVLAIMTVGAGIALAVSQGTAGELNYQAVSRTPDSGGFSIRATCPSTRHVTGGGYEEVDVDLQVSRPFDGTDSGNVPDDGWLVSGTSLGGTPIDVYAICDD